MKRTYVKVLHYAKNDTGWEETGTELLNCFDGQTNMNIEVKSDAFQMSLYLDSDLPLSLFGIDDKIEVFAKTFNEGDTIDDFDISDSDTFDSTILFSGLINQWKLNITDAGARIVILQGVNVSERLLKTFLPAVYLESGEYTTAPEIIQNILGRVNPYSGNKPLLWDPANPTVNSKGEAFYTIPIFATVDKPCYQSIRDLSGNEYTQDGQYYFYIKSKSDGNYFVWRRREDVSLSGVELTEGVDFIKPEIEFGIWDVVNYLIINSGVAPSGNGIKAFAMDTISMGEVGMRAEYVTKGDIAERMHRAEIANNPTRFPVENQRFPEFDSGSYTTYFDGTVCDNFSDYNSWFRTTARKTAKGWAYDEVISKGKEPRYRLRCESMWGRQDLVPGEVYVVTLPSAGWELSSTSDTREKLRLVDVSHTIGSDGWKTTFNFEQDFEVFNL